MTFPTSPPAPRRRSAYAARYSLFLQWPLGRDVSIKQVFVVLLTGVFQDLPVWPECEHPRVLPGLCVCLGVIDRNRVSDVTGICTLEGLNNVQLFAMRMADRVQPGIAVETHGV